MGVKISDIVIGQRHRRNFGDITSLKESIGDPEVGLIHPIVLQPGSLKLVAGGRRLQVLKELGYEELPDEMVRFLDIKNIIKGEYDENECRKDFDPSEKVAIFEAIIDEKKEISSQKQKESGTRTGLNFGIQALDKFRKERAESKVDKDSPKFGESFEDPASNNELPLESDSSGELALPDDSATDENTDEIMAKTKCKTGKDTKHQGEAVRMAGKAVGWSGPTLEKAAFICQKAKEDPENFMQFQEEMDETKSVDAAYKAAKTHEAILSRKTYGPSPELLKLSETGGARELPKFIFGSMTLLPHSKQKDIIEKYGKLLFQVQRSTYDKGVKIFSAGAGMEAMDENALHECMEDMLSVTRDEVEKWVHHDSLGNVTIAFNSVVTASGTNSSTLDKLEFFCIVQNIANHMLLTYLNKASRDKELEGIDPKALKKFGGFINKTLEFAQEGFVLRIANKCKEVYGKPEDIKNPTRKTVNAMTSHTAILSRMDASSYWSNRLKALMRNAEEKTGVTLEEKSEEGDEDPPSPRSPLGIQSISHAGMEKGWKEEAA